MSQALNIRNMTRKEVDLLVDWAAAEGWNPGLHDADIFWATDPKAFIAADLDGVLIGGGAITSYQGDFGFMGFFIIKPEFRGRGLGNQLWQERRQRLINRLKPGAPIGMDGVFAMQDYYAKGGFVFSHRNLRFQSDIPALPNSIQPKQGKIVKLDSIPFKQVLQYDRLCFPADRTNFLDEWVTQPDSMALACQENNHLRGYGVIRDCREGCKVGPLFADDLQTANALLSHLSKFAAGGPLFLDAPENNPAAMALVRQHKMQEVFGCARMYLGAAPRLAEDRIFGITTFELG